MKKIISIFASLSVLIACTSCGNSSGNVQPEDKANPSVSVSSSENDSSADTAESENIYNRYDGMSAEEIVNSLTLEQKAAQMVQPAVYMLRNGSMRENDYGSILSTNGLLTSSKWADLVDGFQEEALASEAGIPYLYGQDDVHGVNYCVGAVIFPHNIGLGAANDEELMYEVGLITADEAKLCHMLWNFAPCVAQSVDPRWGRTYESYGADLDIITSLSTAYTRGLVDGGVIACAKHYIADGNVEFGTGENSDARRLIDRGNSTLNEEQINELLKVYQAQIDAGVQTIMISHSALNGLKMHENAEYIQLLKNDMGFEGFIVSDWNSVQNTSPATYEQQVITAVNAGIDMLMEISTFEEARQIIINAVNNGDISQERVDDAVTRIIRVKLNEGIFQDPFCEDMDIRASDVGSNEYRQVAEQLVEESLVLMKNDNDILPLKSGASVYITGPAADNARAQCGGWTLEWNGSTSGNIQGVTTILEGFREKAGQYGINIITDENEADKADVVLLAVGEDAYAEWLGDTADLELCGALGLKGNRAAIDKVKSLGKPVVTCIVAGRQVIIDKADYDNWDSVVMCYLPGSEGQGVADVLCGDTDFRGKLPSPWYDSVDQIGTVSSWLEQGYGLNYD